MEELLDLDTYKVKNKGIKRKTKQLIKKTDWSPKAIFYKSGVPLRSIVSAISFGVDAVQKIPVGDILEMLKDKCSINFVYYWTSTYFVRRDTSKS